MKFHRQQHQPSRAFSAFPLQQQQKGAKMAAPAAIPPPVVQSAFEVQQAKRDVNRQAQQRKGYQATVLAGETTGYSANPNEKQTVLGG